MSFEVSEPILNSPFQRPAKYWYIQEGYPGVSRTTLELLQWRRREGREKRPFFGQLKGQRSSSS